MYYPGTASDGLLDGFRLRVEQDTDAENPTSWGDHVVEGDDIHRKWVRDEVYVVVMEHYVPYVDPTGEFPDSGRWLKVEALGGCYLDAGYTALDVAIDHGFEGVDHTELVPN